MPKALSLFLLTFLLLQLAQSATDYCEPQQIHIALSDAFTSSPTSNNTIKAIFHTQRECLTAYISLKTPQGEVIKIAATAVNLLSWEKFFSFEKILSLIFTDLLEKW